MSRYGCESEEMREEGRPSAEGSGAVSGNALNRHEAIVCAKNRPNASCRF